MPPSLPEVRHKREAAPAGGRTRRTMCAAVSEELRGGPRPWLGWIAWALIVGTLGSIVIQGFRAALGYDEAYNLQVVGNLVHGHGYATNGTLYGDGTSREAFDPAITTGPTLLVPDRGY